MRLGMALVVLLCGLGCAPQPVGTLGAGLSRASGSRAFTGASQKIRASCAAQWPGDFSGTALCVDMQTDGLEKARRFVERHEIEPGASNSVAQILMACTSKWRSLDGSPDWSGIGLCVEMQGDGLRKVQRFSNEHGIQGGEVTPESEILEACSRKWRHADGRPDWSGTGLCVQMQWDGYRRLNSDGARTEDHAAPSGCSSIVEDSDRLACFDRGTAGVPAGTNILDMGMWEVVEEVDPLDDSISVFAALQASEGRSFSHPEAVLVLRCMDDESDFYVYWGGPLDFEGEGVEVVSRVGRATAETQRWGLSTDKEATFFLGDAAKLIEALANEERFVAQIRPPGSSPVTAVFELRGVEAAIAPLREACD